MPDTTVKKINAEYSPEGEMGQKYLASGKTLAMRLWQDEQPNIVSLQLLLVLKLSERAL